MAEKPLIDLRRRLAAHAIVGFKTRNWADPSAQHRADSAATSKVGAKVGVKPGSPSSPRLGSR